MFEHMQAWEGDELKLSPVGWLPLPPTQAERMVAALATRAHIFLRPPAPGTDHGWAGFQMDSDMFEVLLGQAGMGAHAPEPAWQALGCRQALGGRSASFTSARMALMAPCWRST